MTRILPRFILALMMWSSSTHISVWGLQWPLTKTLAKMIDSFDRRALRTLENISCYRHVPNKELHVLTLQPAYSHLIAIHRIRWYGHVLCFSPEHPTWALLKATSVNPKMGGWNYLFVLFSGAARWHSD